MFDIFFRNHITKIEMCVSDGAFSGINRLCTPFSCSGSFGQCMGPVAKYEVPKGQCIVGIAAGQWRRNWSAFSMRLSGNGK